MVKNHIPLRSKICHHKKIDKFGFDHSLKKRRVFILIKKTSLKIKSCGFRPKNARYEKMLRSKIVHLKEIYNCDFDHFLIKRTVFVLSVKNVIKNQKFNFPDKLCDIQKNVKEQNCSLQKDTEREAQRPLGRAP